MTPSATVQHSPLRLRAASPSRVGDESQPCLDRYAGICAVCGALSRFAYFGGSTRESYACEGCGASMRERGVAQALLDFYGAGQTCVRDLCEHPGFAALSVYEPGTSGPHRVYMKRLKRYRQSCFRKDVAPGTTVDGLVNQDLERLTFDSGSFDVVITSDILEHVRRPSAAFAEIKRVLRLGGRHIFTVPLQYPMRPKTVFRVDTSTDEDRPLLPPVYHGDGAGGNSLVYTDFGEDLLDDLSRSGMSTSIHFVDATNSERRKVIVFVSQKSA